MSTTGQCFGGVEFSDVKVEVDSRRSSTETSFRRLFIEVEVAQEETRFLTGRRLIG